MSSNDPCGGTLDRHDVGDESLEFYFFCLPDVPAVRDDAPELEIDDLIEADADDVSACGQIEL